jgi:hypothetical protein
MQYLDFLAGVHEKLEPPTYLEIGIRHGHSLALSRAPRTIGVDPDFDLRTDPPEGADLHEQTSDDFFARGDGDGHGDADDGHADPLAHFRGQPAALTFIDGMHLAEYALRDFINVERHSSWSSVVMIDDILPRDPEEANRARSTRAWTGDVFKLLGVFAKHRPDLTCLRVGASPTGVLLVLGLDPNSTVLSERYDDIAARIVTPDPQDVPKGVLARDGVLDPESVLNASFWELLHEANAGAEEGRAKLRKALRKDFGRLSRLRDLLPSR